MSADPAPSATIWVTGASSGLGAAVARTAPYDGARLIDLSRSGGTPGEPGGPPAGIEHVPADLADPASWSAVEAHLLAQLGGPPPDVAVFVHAAGTLDPIGPAGSVDSAAYRANVLLNAAAPLVLGHAFLGAVAASRYEGRAALVLISSGAARTAYEGWSSYGAGKAAADQWARAVALEQARRPNPCRVLSVAPGVIATPMQAAVRAAGPDAFPAHERFVGLHERGELRDPDDAARQLWTLVTSDAPPAEPVIDLRTLPPAPA